MTTNLVGSRAVKRDASDLSPRDPEAFFRELNDLTKRVYADRQPDDVAHFRRIQRIGRGFSLLGYATAWLTINPISALALALGSSARWMIVAHHVLHKGYDAYPHTSADKPSVVFGRGARRFIDWCDWIPVSSWKHEHNTMHHYRLGEPYDPDVPETNLQWLAAARIPQFIKYVALALVAFTWKWSYYGPSTIQSQMRKRTDAPVPFEPLAPSTWNPIHPTGRKVWAQSWMPYAIVRLGLLPLAFLPLGRHAWLMVLINTLIAEALTNLHTFFVIVPNHAGDDLVRFRNAPSERNELRLRQILGSVNYRTGGDANDFLHGWLNYQIEHHLWPDLSLRQYQRCQPELKALCEKHGILYTQQSIFRRIRKMAENVTGASQMINVDSVDVSIPSAPAPRNSAA